MTQRFVVSYLPSAWRDFAQFVRRPALVQPLGLRAGWRTVLAMLGLNLLGLMVLLLILPLWQHLTGIDGPSAFKDIPARLLVPIAVVAAPLFEESVFRGWLSGRPRGLWLLGCCLSAAILAVTLPPASAKAGFAVLAAIVLAILGWVLLRKRATPGWLARRYAWLFFASAIVFGLVHVMNYTNPGLLTVPMVLPQLWAGLTLGFVRARVGLPASMLVHGTSNALALLLVGLGR